MLSNTVVFLKYTSLANRSTTLEKQFLTWSRHSTAWGNYSNICYRLQYTAM